MVDLEDLARQLLLELRLRGPLLGLADALEARYVPNPGNLCNANFTVTDGRRRLHVKLAPADGPDDLSRWFALRDLLETRYRAPPVLAALTVGAYQGLVFPHLAGRVPGDDLLPDVVHVARRVHGDADLAKRLRDGPPPSLRDCYRAGVFACLSEDLRSVKADPDVRALLSREEIRFAENEVETLRGLGEEQLPEEPATAAIHGDLWLQNVLVSTGTWYLLDWDAVRIGDPAGEYASLLHEPWHRGIDPEPLLPNDADLRARFAVWLRAHRFDAIVDPLSDLTECPRGLPDREATWARRVRRSRTALIRYRAAFPGDIRPD